jgi:quercetin 2,3-dioxygenase
MEKIMIVRKVQKIIPSVGTSDGAGVKLRRSIGGAGGVRIDPFLMLDEFYSDNPGDYLAGFPSHPHRGFETVTYMLDGHMRHEDNLGNRGDLGPGDVQWMRAARGIIHSEMPQQTQGRMRGFQLWVNLPAREKMKPAWYEDIPAERIPTADLSGGGKVRVLHGSIDIQGQRFTGATRSQSAASLYLDVTLGADESWTFDVPSAEKVFLYLYEGDALVGEEGQPIPSRAAAMLGEGDAVSVRGGTAGARLLVLAGTPIGEPVVQYGPFVMNTRAEIEQAIDDYQSGRLASG